MHRPGRPRGGTLGEGAAVPRRRRGLRDLVDTVWHEMGKFGVVGAVNFVIDIGLLNLLIATVLSDKVTTARIISGTVATLFSWLANRSWTFARRRSRPAHHEVTLFLVVNGLALGISTLCLVISHYGLDLRTTLADNVSTILGIGLGTVFRFWAYRTVVFAPRTRD